MTENPPYKHTVGVATGHEISELATSKDLAVKRASCARYSGASIGRDHLVIATVQGSSLTGFELCLEQSAQIELEDRDSESLRYFRDDLEAFVKTSGISKVLLRSLPKNGKYHTGLGLKIEAALQLNEGLETEIVHFNTVEKWLKYSHQLAPTLIDGLVHWERRVHAYAIATACFGESHNSSTSAQSERA